MKYFNKKNKKMNNEPNDKIINIDSNKSNKGKNIISSKVIDFLNLSESGNKKSNKEEIKSTNVKSSINNYEISTFKKDDWNKPIKIYSKEEIINNMNIIFLNYATYSIKKNLYLISVENIIKLIKDIGFLFDLIKLYQIDLLIKKVSPKLKYIIFEDFMSILIKIAQKAFPTEFKKNKDLLLNHFFHTIFSIYDTILTEELVPLNDLIKYPYSSITSLMNIIPDDSQILVLNSLLYTLNEIYEKYFIYNTNINSGLDNDHNLSNFFDFCKDFEIIPFIFNDTQIITYYNTVLGKKDLFRLIDDSNEKNNIFTFNNFILFFIHLSEYYYAKIYLNFKENEKKETQLSKLIMLLTKLECSKGMRNIINSSLPNLSLMPSKELLLKYNFIFKKESENFDNFLEFQKNEENENNFVNNGGESIIKDNLFEDKNENKDNLQNHFDNNNDN